MKYLQFKAMFNDKTIYLIKSNNYAKQLQGKLKMWTMS